jgi:hypothetical protein
MKEENLKFRLMFKKKKNQMANFVCRLKNIFLNYSKISNNRTGQQ